MKATNTSVGSELRQLPPEREMDRADAVDAFVAVANAVEPRHPFSPSPYPLSRDDVDYGVTRTAFASCGPRNPETGYQVGYNTRLTYIRECSRERHLALLVHEVTHITVGRHSDEQHGSHPRRFWEKMAYNAALAAESLESGDLSVAFPDADVDGFLREVADDPNGSTVDRRYWTVDECKAAVADIATYFSIRGCPADEFSEDVNPRTPSGGARVAARDRPDSNPHLPSDEGASR